MARRRVSARGSSAAEAGFQRAGAILSRCDGRSARAASSLAALRQRLSSAADARAARERAALTQSSFLSPRRRRSPPSPTKHAHRRAQPVSGPATWRSRGDAGASRSEAEGSLDAGEHGGSLDLARRRRQAALIATSTAMSSGSRTAMAAMT